MNARSQRRIFFRAWVAIIRLRVIISGEWRSLRTQNLASSRSLTPQRLHHPKSEGCERCRYACRDRLCSPTVPVVTSHIRVDERARGASDDRYACCRRSCSPTRYVTRATLRVYCDMGLLGFCEEYYIFQYGLMDFMFIHIRVI